MVGRRALLREVTIASSKWQGLKSNEVTLPSTEALRMGHDDDEAPEGTEFPETDKWGSAQDPASQVQFAYPGSKPYD